MRRRKQKRLLRSSLLGLGISILGTGIVLLVRKLQGQRSDTGLSSSDQDFVRQAAQDELAEVELGHLAGQRGQDEAVRELGQRLIKDYGRAHGELVSLALARGFVPPGYLPASKRIEVETLSRLPVAAFDERFAHNLISEQRNAVARFQQQSTCGDDPALRDFAKRMLPTLHDHLRLAMDLRTTDGRS